MSSRFHGVLMCGHNERLYAMKTLQKHRMMRSNQVAHTRAERRILQLVHSPFLVRLHYAFQTADKLYMCLDFCAGGDLYYHLRQCRPRGFSIDRVRLYSAEILLALECLHAHDIAFRDLKVRLFIGISIVCCSYPSFCLVSFRFGLVFVLLAVCLHLCHLPVISTHCFALTTFFLVLHRAM